MTEKRIIPMGESERIPMPSPEDLAKMTAMVFGFAGAGLSEWIRSGGRIIGAVWMSRTWKQFMEEIKHFHDQGKIKEDYFSTAQSFENLTEILDYFDKGVPNEQVWDVLRRIYFVAASEQLSKRDQLVPQQYMRVAKSMSSAEILVLFAGYRRSVGNGGVIGHWNIEPKNWSGQIALLSGLKHAELVTVAVSSLISKGLLAPIKNPGNETHERFTEPNYQGLTEFGFSLSKYVETYEQVKSEVQKDGT